MDKLSLDLDYDLAPFGYEVCLDWQSIPEDIQPDVPQSRLARKKEQLQNLAKAIIKVGGKLLLCSLLPLLVLPNVVHALPMCLLHFFLSQAFRWFSAFDLKLILLFFCRPAFILTCLKGGLHN